MQSLSLSSLVQMDNFLKVLILAIRVHMEDTPLDESILKESRMWHAGAKNFIKEFDIDSKAFTAIYQSLRKTPGAYWDQLYDFAIDYYSENAPAIKADLDVPRNRLSMMNSIFRCIITQKDARLNEITKNISIFGDTFMTRLYAGEISANNSDQKALRVQLNAFMKKYFKKTSDLTVEDKAKLKAKDPEAYKIFNKLNRDINGVTKAMIMDYVRSTGKLTVPVSDMQRFLKKNDIENNIPVFKGFIDEDGTLYNELNVKIAGSVTGRIEMNPAYDAKTDNTYVFNHFPLFGAGAPQRIYTVEYKTRKTNKKFDVVDKLTKDIDKLRKKWLVDMRGDLTKATTLTALVIELIYLTSGRIGSVTGASGISALVRKEFSDKAANWFTLTYQGKKNVEQQHKVKTNTRDTQYVLKALQTLAKGKKPNDLLITLPKGTIVGSAMVKKYLMSIGAPEGTTVHKFRHVRGTKIAKEIMGASKYNKKSATPPKEAEVNKWFMDAMKQVGQELGHVAGDKVTGMTALVNYIDPRAVEDWFNSINVRPSATLQKIIDKLKKEVE